MKQLDRELEQAREELSFWRDYAQWWESEHADTPQPRIAEALKQARDRYEQARLRRSLQRLI